MSHNKRKRQTKISRLGRSFLKFLCLFVSVFRADVVQMHTLDHLCCVDTVSHVDTYPT